MSLPMRTGLVGEVAPSDAALELETTYHALLRIFCRDALVVSGRYSVARGVREVDGATMRAALMYCARTFFEQDEAALQARLAEETARMDEEESSDAEAEEAESDGSGGGGESGGSDEGAGDEAEEDESGGGGGESDEESDGGIDVGDDGGPRDLALARHVDAIVAAWPQWQPEDPLHRLIKRSIDDTAVDGAGGG
jgi:hypothetical protein